MALFKEASAGLRSLMVRKLLVGAAKKVLTAVGLKEKSKYRQNVKLTRPTYFDRHKGRDFLILGAGPSLVEYNEKIRAFVKENNLIVIGCNSTGLAMPCDYYGFINRFRFTQFAHLAREGDAKLLVNIYFQEKMVEKFHGKDYEYIVWKDTEDPRSTHISDDGVIHHHGGTATILILVAYIMGAQRVYIAGMDGTDQATPDEVTGKTKLKTEAIHFTPLTYKPTLSEEELVGKYLRHFNDVLPFAHKSVWDWAEKADRIPYVSLTPTFNGDYYDKNLLG